MQNKVDGTRGAWQSRVFCWQFWLGNMLKISEHLANLAKKLRGGGGLKRKKQKERHIQVEEERESERQNLRHLPQTRTHLYFSSLRLSSQHFPRSSRTIYGGCWCGCCWPLSISQQPQQKRQRQQEKQPRLALNIWYIPVAGKIVNLKWCELRGQMDRCKLVSRSPSVYKQKSTVWVPN